MSKFNESAKNRSTTFTYEGAPAVQKDLVEDWVNNLFSNNLEDAFYESQDQRLGRFEQLTTEIRKRFGDNFTAKLANFARNEIGMRSVSQVVAGMLNDSKMAAKREFYRTFCHRPDDCSEIFSYLEICHGAKPSHAMVRGFADYLSSLSEYQLGKYMMRGKSWNMYDLVNITHAHSNAIDMLKAGKLDSPDTWEVSISTSKDEDEKAKNWIRLVEEHKLGYTALLMNLRNILESAPNPNWIKKVLCPQIEDEAAIQKSLMFPYKIYNAYKNYKSSGISNLSVDYSLDNAFMHSCKLAPHFEGSTAVLIDVSGSMSSPYSKHSSMSILEISACYAAAFLLSNPGVEVYKFGSYGKKFYNWSVASSAFSLIEALMDNSGCGYSTNIGEVYKILDRHYDRILIFSDMQVMEDRKMYWNNYESPITTHKEYCKHFGMCKVYSFDLGNYPSCPENVQPKMVKYFTTLSPQVFNFIQILESGQSIVDYINENY